MRAHPAERRLHRLAHDVLNLAGDAELALALHLHRFDEEDVAAGRSPGQSNHDSGTLGARRDLGIDADLDAAQHLLHHLAGDHQLFGLALDDAARLLAADGSDLPLQAAHSGLARVVADQEADRVRRKLDLLRSETVLLGLPPDQVLVR